MARQYPEVALELDGKRFTLVFDMAAVRVFEREAGISIYELVAAAATAQETGKMPKLTDLGCMMMAGLHRHHPELDVDQCMEMFSNQQAQMAMMKAFNLAQPENAGAGDASDESAAADPVKGRRKK